jgi:RHS repeat-associated protein
MIHQDDYTTIFTYNSQGERVKMSTIFKGMFLLQERYYIGGRYEISSPGEVGDYYYSELLYLGGDAYSAPAVYKKVDNVWNIYYICRDYLGSINVVTDANGAIVQEMAYDPWGRLRNPHTHQLYENEPTLFLGRGFTGHEHLQWYGLINMNARLYDPLVGRFLSPDPYVQDPTNTQNYNRYSYVLNNPLKYTDPTGERYWYCWHTGTYATMDKYGAVRSVEWNEVSAWMWNTNKFERGNDRGQGFADIIARTWGFSSGGSSGGFGGGSVSYGSKGGQSGFWVTAYAGVGVPGDGKQILDEFVLHRVFVPTGNNSAWGRYGQKYGWHGWGDGLSGLIKTTAQIIGREWGFNEPRIEHAVEKLRNSWIGGKMSSWSANRNARQAPAPSVSPHIIHTENAHHAIATHTHPNSQWVYVNIESLNINKVVFRQPGTFNVGDTIYYYEIQHRNDGSRDSTLILNKW